jgi:hypothetical protein
MLVTGAGPKPFSAALGGGVGATNGVGVGVGSGVGVPLRQLLRRSTERRMNRAATTTWRLRDEGGNIKEAWADDGIEVIMHQIGIACL